MFFLAGLSCRCLNLLRPSAVGKSRPEPHSHSGSRPAGTVAGRLLELVRAFDESESWHEEGIKSCALLLG